LKNTKAYEYCKKSVRAKTTPKYVKKQMREFIRISEDKDKRYMINEAKYKQIEAVLKLLIMPKGLKAGQTLYECTTGYQWLIYTAVLCTVYRDNPERRRYETCILEICRKNFKTYTVGTLFIILFITEPKFSEFYSVAPDGKLSREIKEAISKTIKSSPLVYEYKGVKRFKLLRDYIEFIVNESKYTPLNYSNSNMDGKLPNVYCADEVGALPSSYAIEAMQSGQLNILNKLGFIISTKYPTIDNPIEEYTAYAKKVLDGLIKDEAIFALLYEPDNPKAWETDDLVLKQANPVALEVPEIWDDLLKKRAKAVAMESARENFVTKHCNIIYQGAGTETYIDVKDVQACKVNSIDWTGRVVYLGVDLSESNDNTSVAMVGVDEDDNVLAEVVAFIPEGRIEEKNAFEKIDYKEFIRTSKAIACGDKVIDYAVVEDFILAIEERYGVQVQAIGYDRYNALSTAQKLERAGYNTIEIRQHSSVLHPPTKRLKEKILAGEFQYTENKLLEINFQNARCTYDTNKNLYVNKKKSKGKVDMVVALINAVYLLEQDYFLNQMDFTIQVV
jgi:phage terminase large subunit-like protein